MRNDRPAFRSTSQSVKQAIFCRRFLASALIRASDIAQFILLLLAPWEFVQGVPMADDAQIPLSFGTSGTFINPKKDIQSAFNVSSVVEECAKFEKDPRTGFYFAPWYLARTAQPNRLDWKGKELTRMYTYDWSFPRKAEWGQNVVVYVIDSGVRASHVQFRDGQVEEGYTIPRFKGTGPGNVPLGHHGTGVASVIGGQTSGMATLATIVPIKVAGETTNEVPETSDDVAEAIKIAEIDWVVRQKMNTKLKAVVNISWTIRNNVAAEKAIANAVAADMHVIIAAGNSDFHVDECFGQTTGKDERVSDQGQITVAFTWYDDNYGGNAGPCVDVLAPSTNMLVAGDDCDTCCHNGEYSSFSAPQVAGLVASILSTSDVHISPAEMRDLIRTKYSIAGHLIGVIPALTTDRLLQSPLQMHPPQ